MIRLDKDGKAQGVLYEDDNDGFAYKKDQGNCIRRRKRLFSPSEDPEQEGEACSS